MSTELTRVIYDNATGDMLHAIVYRAWNVRGMPERGIWIDMGDDNGIHITADQLDELGFIEEEFS